MITVRIISTNPTMLSIAADRIAVSYHGITHTHLDSLAHVNEQGVFYNGYRPNAEAVLQRGHEKNSIHNVKNGVLLEEASRDATLRHIRHLWGYDVSLVGVDAESGEELYECSTDGDML